MNVLIACEESQRVCIEFRKRGHEAYSADIQEPSGGHPEWHILGDVLKILAGGVLYYDGRNTALYTAVGYDYCASYLHVSDERCDQASQLEMHAARKD